MLCIFGVYVKLLDEIQNEVWHILVSIYTHKRLLEGIPKCLTRYDMANQFVALNELAEMLVIRIARLADERKDARSISLLLKRANFGAASAEVAEAGKKFIILAKPLVKIRHEKVAHMKPGVLSSYEPKSPPVEALRATEALVDLIDTATGQHVSYTYKIGSMEALIDLRASLATGTMVAAQQMI